MMKRDGSRFFASGTTNAVRDETGSLLGFTKIMRDATDHKRSEEALKNADRARTSSWQCSATNCVIHSPPFGMLCS